MFSGARLRRGVVAAVPALVLAAACGGSGSAPRSPVTPTPAPEPARLSTRARVVGTLAPAPGIGGATVASEELGEVTTAADGSFTLQTAAPLTSAIRVSEPLWIERQTFLKVPGGDATVSLIPRSINLTYFDEMCRGFGRLLRWGSPPALVVETAVLQYGTRVATEDVVPSDTVERTIGEIRSGLAIQTAGRFADYSTVEIRKTPPGTRSAGPTGAIGLTWQRGLLEGFGHVAYGGRGGGAADGGLIYGELALDFEWHVYGLPAGSRRDVFNVVQHELGHTLGYSHTKIAPSFMYEVYLMSVSAQDRQAFEIVMQRPSGNQTPDVDPRESSVNFNAVPQPMDIPRCAFLAR